MPNAEIGGLTITNGAITGVTSIAPSTDVAVADGGTGASTAQDARTNLLPSKTGNALKVLRVNAGETDYELAASAGGGDLVSTNNLSDVANAGTARTNLGVGTGDSPQFTAVNIGHATDTTLARSGAGDLTVEGNALYRAGGTDVPVADGGTGASDAATARTNLGAQATLVSGTNIKTVNSTTLLGSGDLAISGGDTVAQAAASAAVAINSTSVVNMASCTNTVAAGDTFSFYMTGYILNNSGAVRTYTVRLTIGATTFDLVHSTTIAASASNVSYLRVLGEIAVISSSSIGCTINTRFGVGAAVGTAQNNVLAQDRSIVRTSTNNETGSKTVAIGIFSSDATATQTFTKTRVEIRKGSAI